MKQNTTNFWPNLGMKKLVAKKGNFFAQKNYVQKLLSEIQGETEREKRQTHRLTKQRIRRAGGLEG